MLKWLVGTNGFFGCEMTETPVAENLPFFLVFSFNADGGSLLPDIDEKLTAQLSKNLPDLMMYDLPPPPSGLFQTSS